MHESDPTRRFSNRVDDYVRFRPGYPRALIATLGDLAGVSPHHDVAEVGSGTGILTRMLLDNGNRVFAVEPNAAMRAAAEAALGGNDRFVTVEGTAEATTLADASVDVVIAAQAFHWFDRDRCRGEFARILGDSGPVVLVWNTRRVDATPFMRDYERLLVEHGVDYTSVDHRNVGDATLDDFYADYRRAVIPFEEALDFEATLGRMASASYVASPGEPAFDVIATHLRGAFDRHQQDGRVTWVYDTEVYAGRLKP